MITPQGLEIGERLLIKYEETRQTTKPTRSEKSSKINLIIMAFNIFYVKSISIYYYE